MKVYVRHKELRAMALALEAQGWTIEIRNSGHLKWTAPNGFMYFSAQTPSDHRAIMNIRRELVRKGGAKL